MLKAIPLKDYKAETHNLPIAVQALKKGQIVAIEQSEDGFVAGVVDASSNITSGYFGIALGDYMQDQGCLLAAKGTTERVNWVWIID